MKDIIRFKGLTLNKDEQSVAHGELSLCGGVELHDGSLRPSVLHGTVLGDGQPLPYHDAGVKLLYVHQTDDYTYYIAWVYPDKLCAFKEKSDGWEGVQSSALVNGEIDANFSTTGLKDVKSVGNTLIVMKSDGLHYFKCYNDGSTWKYKYLGQQPPFLQLQFGLELSGASSALNVEEFKYEVIEGAFFDQADESYRTIAEDKRASFTDHVMSKVNKRIDGITQLGQFYAPFLIRYCYRMYDGSMIMHSAPVLMMPMLHRPVMTYSFSLSNGAPNPKAEDDENFVEWSLFLRPCRLRVRSLNGADPVENYIHLSDWKDIIRSVDIFITPQFSRIDTSKMIEKVGVNYTDFNYSLYDGTENNIPTIFEATYSTDWPTEPRVFGSGISILFPEYAESDYLSKIRRASYFYKLTSVELEDIGDKLVPPSGGNPLKRLQFDASVLSNIAVQEQMVDDYKTHNKILPAIDSAGLYIYNNRLNCFGISEKLFIGFNMSVLFPYFAASSALTQYTLRVYIKTDSGIFAVECPNGEFAETFSQSWLLKNGYIFYPDARAIAMHLHSENGNLLSVKRRLTASDELNASLSFCDDSEINELPSYVNYDLVQGNRTINNSRAIVPLTNKVYTSRADNPFYFPNLPDEAGINTVGVGDILGLAVPKRSLTADMAGFNDLIIFCTDGIWIAKVSKTGTYSEKHNISSEVLYNVKSLCQLDQSVVFATSRALARIVGQDVASLTDVLDGPYFDVKNKLTAFSDVYCIDPEEGESYPTGYDFDADSLIRFNAPPLDFYRKGKVFYDYIGSRIIVLPDDTTESCVALVFSIRDEAWATMVIPPIQSVVDGYPYMFVQYTDTDFDLEGMVMRLDLPYDHSDNVLHTGVVVTRTLTFSDTMDVFRGFRQMIDSANMPQMYIFGSNDQRTWKYIGNSARSFHNYIPGHPYRFFRLALYIRMLTGERYQQIELEIINKYAKL